MKLFGRTKSENWIIKLFKITDGKIAESFDMENCILLAIDLISQNTSLIATDFDLNYRDSKKTLKGFKKALKSHNEIVYSFVGFDSDRTDSFFTVSNAMLNLTEKPENSSIDICMQINSDFGEQKIIEQIAEKLIEEYDFEYGYVTRLPSNYDCLTERKIKKGLFSVEVGLNKMDHIWSFHTVGINEGFIKSIYPVNYLNQSHTESVIIKELILKQGVLERVSKNISKWSLNLDELKYLKSNKGIYKVSIATSDLGFLKNEKSKVFKDKMKLNNFR